ncbi:hypothetical protein LTR59_010268 [Friedmanniomyces endolithicus]|nr:hypothetical protein LTR94_013724 [Friedmanniomyces endolithicus]KAK0787600.1 hypothetical protein LTR59_010268 [Friedmanniomyces endolithicus]KAK0795115.1 hypothetical protein LTR38_009038 [Friedmanniomyces endolithicus]
MNNLMMSSSTGTRVAIVTGASKRYDFRRLTTWQSGIGEALTRELINRGWFVAMADLRESKALTDEFGSKAKFYETDLPNLRWVVRQRAGKIAPRCE